ncbi:MAG: MarR family winged helix-turn-helix transcriptional regulator [Bacteroidota bacterium]
MKYSFDKSLGKITHQISKGLGKKLVEKFTKHGYNISSLEWTVISYLYYNKESNQKEIGKFISENKVRTKRIIDNLEKQGHVKRSISKKDKRKNTVKLTSGGEKLYLTLAPLAEKTLSEAYSGLSKKEINQCFTTLLKIQEKLSNE